MLENEFSMLESNTFLPKVTEKGSGCPEKLSTQGWNILLEDVSFPIAVINEEALRKNAHWMQTFCELAGVKLAPHGKTTMMPALFKLQLAQGAWGISLATVPQVVNAYRHGINRIMLANQLVGRYHFKLVADLLAQGEIDFYCFVDSVDNIHSLGQYFDQRNISLNVLIEIGVDSGRCGWRDTNAVNQLVDAIAQYESLQLTGVSFYEGVIHGSDALAEIETFVLNVSRLTNQLARNRQFSGHEVVITGAGSAWYDVVAKQLIANLDESINYTAIIRPGCYLVHDTGIYQQAQQAVLSRSQLACDISGELISSLELWAYVHSTPEPGLAIIGLGKRDVAFDAGLPIPKCIYQPGNALPTAVNQQWQITQIMDQHCMLRIPQNATLKPGDLICFSSSHPCLTLDKWRQVGIVDENYVIRQTIETYF